MIDTISLECAKLEFKKLEMLCKKFGNNYWSGGTGTSRTEIKNTIVGIRKDLQRVSQAIDKGENNGI